MFCTQFLRNEVLEAYELETFNALLALEPIQLEVSTAKLSTEVSVKQLLIKIKYKYFFKLSNSEPPHLLFLYYHITY